VIHGDWLKALRAIDVVKTVKNWHTVFADDFSLAKQKYVVYILRNGLEYKLRAGTYDRWAFNEIWLHNTYTPKGFSINLGDTVVDIGAHIGIFSILASKFAGAGKVYSVEPMPENFALLKHNIKANKIRNITAINKALDKKTGHRKLFISENTAAHSFHFKGNKTINVPTITMDRLVRQEKIRHIDFLKMDCEGAEYEVLFNCPDKVLRMIKKISLEYHDMDESRNGQSLKEFLERKGFKVKMEWKATTDKGITTGMLFALKDDS